MSRTTFHRDTNGAAAVEFALVAPTFFFLIFATFQLAFYFIQNQNLEAGLQVGARAVQIGTAASDSDLRGYICSNAPLVPNCYFIGLYVQVFHPGDAIPNPLPKPLDATGQAHFEVGAPGDIVILRAWSRFNWVLIYFPDLSSLITATAVVPIEVNAPVN